MGFIVEAGELELGKTSPYTGLILVKNKNKCP